METPGQMYFPQMLLLLLLMGVCTFWLGRLLQWILLRKMHPRRKIFSILVISLLLSYMLALFFWLCWPQQQEPLWGIFFLPAVSGELIIIITTIILYRRRKQT